MSQELNEAIDLVLAGDTDRVDMNALYEVMQELLGTDSTQ